MHGERWPDRKPSDHTPVHHAQEIAVVEHGRVGCGITEHTRGQCIERPCLRLKNRFHAAEHPDRSPALC